MQGADVFFKDLTAIPHWQACASAGQWQSDVVDTFKFDFRRGFAEVWHRIPPHGQQDVAVGGIFYSQRLRRRARHGIAGRSSG